MRWTKLFAALESQVDSLAARELSDEVSERTRYEIGTIPLVARLAGSIGRTVKVAVTGEGTITGQLQACGHDWLLLADRTQILVPLNALGGITGLAALHGPLPSPASSDLRRTMRALARDRAGVEITIGMPGPDGVALRYTGTIDRVGADWLELALHASWEARRAGQVQATMVLPLRAIALIRSVATG